MLYDQLQNRISPIENNRIAYTYRYWIFLEASVTHIISKRHHNNLNNLGRACAFCIEPMSRKEMHIFKKLAVYYLKCDIYTTKLLCDDTCLISNTDDKEDFYLYMANRKEILDWSWVPLKCGLQTIFLYTIKRVPILKCL